MTAPTDSPTRTDVVAITTELLDLLAAATRSGWRQRPTAHVARDLAVWGLWAVSRWEGPVFREVRDTNARFGN